VSLNVIKPVYLTPPTSWVCRKPCVYRNCKNAMDWGPPCPYGHPSKEGNLLVGFLTCGLQNIVNLNIFGTIKLSNAVS